MTLAVSSYATTAVPTAVTTPQQNTSSSSGTGSNSTATTTTSSGGDQLSLSAQAQQALAQQALAAANTRGALVFDAQGATVGGKRVALMDIINSTDGTYTETERAAAVRQINQRETAGFRWAKPTSSDPTEIKRYYATYLNYLKKLPAAEQNSTRYKGEIDRTKSLMKEADRQIVMQNVQQGGNLASYSAGGLGAFAPMMSGISARISQQLAGLPNTNLTSAARYFQQTITGNRTAEQVLASLDPAKATGSSSGSGSASSGTKTGTTTSVQA